MSLSRDTTNTNGTIAKTPDVNDILNQQADTMAAAYNDAYKRGDSEERFRG